MSPATHAPWLPHVAHLVRERLGLHFPRERWPDLLRGVRAVARESGAPDADAVAQTLLHRPLDAPRFEMLAQALTVGETYFFRERRSFEVLADEILPALIASRAGGDRRLRLWSAGCCTGEEAYSLAIVVDRLLPQPTDWHVTILGTDLNPRFLRAAERGEYGEWSFRDAPAWLKRDYFTPIGHQRYTIDPAIRRRVRFGQLNLADLAYPRADNGTEGIDVILCRNVLMYFAPALMRRVVTGLQDALVEGGRLSVSATELAALTFDPLVPERYDGVVFHRKAGRAVPHAAAARWLPLESRTPWAGGAEAPAPDAMPAAENAPAAPNPGVLQLAREHADAGRLGLALTVVEDALVVAKLDAGAHHLHAVILEELGRLGEARASLQRALYLEPDFVLAHHALGRLALREGAPEQARRHFGSALSLLACHRPDDLLPRSDGLAAGQLKAVIDALLTRSQS